MASPRRVPATAIMTRGRPFGLIARDGALSTRDAAAPRRCEMMLEDRRGIRLRALEEEVERCEAISHIWEKFKLRTCSRAEI